jgi:hypothetical protein
MKIQSTIIILIIILFSIGSVDASMSFRQILGGNVADETIELTDLPQNIPSIVQIEIATDPQMCQDKDGRIIPCNEPQGEEQPKVVIMQLLPNVSVLVSEDKETILQVSGEVTPQTALEVYYNYQDTITEPWSHYARVEGNTIIKSNFTTREIWTESITTDRINEIVDVAINEGGIPEWGEL